MTLSMSTRYAARSLTRHRRRTLLSLIGIAIGGTICLLCLAWMRGERDMVIRAAVESGAGHLRVVPPGYSRDRDDDKRLEDGEGLLSSLRSLPEVRVATPRLRLEALLGMGTRSANLQLTGVDPVTEPGAQRFVRHVQQGRYLQAGDTNSAVIGAALGQRLSAGVGDEVVATVVTPDGELQSALFSVVGIIATGSKDIDSNVFHVPLDRAEAMQGHSGISEITIVLPDAKRVPEMRERVAALVPSGAGEVLTYREVAPELLAGSEVDALFLVIIAAIVFSVVFLGLLSAQLTAVLERRRETAVLAALGMSRPRLWMVQLKEGLLLSAAGGTLTLLLGLPLVYYLATTGINLAELSGEQTVSGVLLDPVLYADFGAWLFPHAFLIATAATLLSHVYPAWFAARTDPITAMRVD